MKIVRICGGLGNQMFQFAFGKALEMMTKDKVYFDKISNTKAKKFLNGIINREYSLDIFNLDIDFANKEEIEETIGKKSNLPKRLRKIFGIDEFEHRIPEKRYCKYYKNFFKNREIAYYIGYYQNEKYFLGIEDYLRKQFTFPEIKDDYNRQNYEKIINTPNSVFLHVRQGDYKSNWRLKADYYKEAIKVMKSKVENPKFFVFGEDCKDFVGKELNLEIDYEFIGEKNTTPETHYEDMRLMSLCQNGITANSSYSWWAAWLIENPNKVIISPTPWLNHQDDIICKNWIKVKNK